MRSVIFSQWRDRMMGVMWLDLGALTTARAREFWICWSRSVGQVVIKRVAVVKLGVNNGSGDGGGCFGIEVWTDTELVKNVKQRQNVSPSGMGVHI